MGGVLEGRSGKFVKLGWAEEFGNGKPVGRREVVSDLVLPGCVVPALQFF